MRAVKLKESVCAILAAMATGLLLGGCGKGPEYPGKNWKMLSPGEAGFDPEKLDSFVDHVGGSGCVIRGGKMVKSWGHDDHPLDIASAVKVVYAHFVYMLIKDGRIESLDDPVMVFEPRLRDLNADLKYKDRKITWRHLVTQTACYGVREAPGTAFDYSDYQSALLIDTVVFNVLRTGYYRADEKLLGPMLADRIGMQDSPTLDGPNVPPGRLRISARDFARFGLLYMRGGKWRSRQVIPPSYVQQALGAPHTAALPRTTQEAAERIPDQRTIGSGENQEMHLNSYSYMWWLNGTMDDGQRVLEGVPADTICAIGHAGGDALVLMPGQDIVICWIDGMEGKSAWRYSKNGRNYVIRAMGYFMQSLRGGSGD